MRARYIGKNMSLAAKYGTVTIVNGGVYDITVSRRKSGRIRIVVIGKNRGRCTPVVYASEDYNGDIEIPLYDLNWVELDRAKGEEE